MPEDPNIPAVEQEAPQAPAPPDPWQPWQQAGFAPDQNPYEIRQHLDWVQAITDENRHEIELERSLREWGHLPEGVSFRDMKEWARQQAATRQDPFGQQPQPQYAPDSQNPYQQPGYEDPYAQPQQPAIDPQQLRQVWQDDMKQVLAQERQQFEQQLQAQRLQDDLTRQFDRVATQHNLTDTDKTWVAREVDRRLRAGEVQSQQQLATIADDVWRELAEYKQQSLASVISAQNGAPRTMTPTGATPGSLPPANGISGAMERMSAHLGIPSQR